MELQEYRDKWQKKPVIRAIYTDYYNKIICHTKPGNILEIGGGSGNLKEFIDNVISLDIQFTPWLDLTADAQELPFRSESFSNIVMIDVLHHIESPIRFLKEACNILRPEGRLIMLEPAISPFSWFFYNFMHDEPVVMSSDPTLITLKTTNRDPFDANQAIPTLLFGRYFNEFKRYFPLFELRQKKYISLFAYPLSGGFKSWSLLPEVFVAPLLKIENKLLPLLGRMMAFRILIVLEKK